MACFVLPHLFEDRPGAVVIGGQAGLVPFEMRFDLTFRLCQKAKAPGIATFACEDAQGQRTCIPDGIEQAFATAEFFDTLRCPGQMLGFFPPRLLQRATYGGIA